jgi:hypothetical protein
LFFFENLLSCVGGYEHRWNGTHQLIYNNYTGESTGVLLSNPNPANGSTVFDTNKLQANPSGIGTSVDVTWENFSVNAGNNISYKSNSSDGYFNAYGKNYVTERSNATSDSVVTNSVYNIVGQAKTITNVYYIYRNCLYFDTRNIPDGAIIIDAKLRFVLAIDKSFVDFDIVVQNGQPVYPHEPMVVGDYAMTFYSGSGGSYNTSLLPAVNNYFYIDLNDDGKSWINKTGTTKLLLRSSRDIDNHPPSTGASYYEYVYFFGNESVNYCPLLFVTYTDSWDNVINVTQSSNSSGSWYNYSFEHIVQNGTHTCLNPNMTSNNTQYWWKVNVTNSSGVLLDQQLFTFTTADRKQLTPLASENIVKYMAGGGCAVVPFLCLLKRGKRKQET